MVGAGKWHRNLARRGRTNAYPKFKRCTFFLQYRRYFNEISGEKSPFELYKFDFTHSHPLSLEYEKADTIEEDHKILPNDVV